MSKESIQSLVSTTMESIQQMVDVNTVIGDAVETPQGVVIIPVSRVSFGFMVGGTDWNLDDLKGQQQNDDQQSFGGGSGAGVTVQPVGFLVVSQKNIHLIPVDEENPYLQLLHMLPEILGDLKEGWGGGKDESSGQKAESECPLGGIQNQPLNQ